MINYFMDKDCERGTLFGFLPYLMWPKGIGINEGGKIKYPTFNIFRYDSKIHFYFRIWQWRVWFSL